MNVTYKKLIVFILGLVEIIAGFAVYDTSAIGAAAFISLGIFFLIITFLIDRQSHHNFKGRHIH